jgi:hypothetical protein
VTRFPAVFTSDGRFMIINHNPETPKFAVDSGEVATPGTFSIVVNCIAGAALAAASAGAFAACGKNDPECDPPSAWRNFNEVTINLTEVGSKSTATYHALFDFAKNDLMMDVDVRDPQAGMHGIIAMVGGRVMISRGVMLSPGSEIDALDGPMLSIQLVEIILGRALPTGPDGLGSTKTEFNYVGKAGVKFATPSASGHLELPWSAKGSARKSKSGSIDFMFELASGEKGAPGAIRNSVIGSLQMSNAPVFVDAMPLNGWTLYGVGAKVEQTRSGTKLDFGAKPMSQPALKTIGDVRAYIAEQERAHAAKKAPTPARSK